MATELLSVRLMANPSVVSAEVDNESVLLDLETDTYFGLNRLGCQVWARLQQGLTGDEIVQHLRGQFQVPEAQLRDDVRSFLRDLQAQGLVQAAGT